MVNLNETIKYDFSYDIDISNVRLTEMIQKNFIDWKDVRDFIADFITNVCPRANLIEVKACIYTIVAADKNDLSKIEAEFALSFNEWINTTYNNYLNNK